MHLSGNAQSLAFSYELRSQRPVAEQDQIPAGSGRPSNIVCVGAQKSDQIFLWQKTSRGHEILLRKRQPRANSTCVRSCGLGYVFKMVVVHRIVAEKNAISVKAQFQQV